MSHKNCNHPQQDNITAVYIGLTGQSEDELVEVGQLPREMRDDLRANLDGFGLPEAAAQALLAQLDSADEREDTSSEDNSESVTDEPDVGDHDFSEDTDFSVYNDEDDDEDGDDNSESESVNEEDLGKELWNIADKTFPSDPHLWHALVALLTVAHLNADEKNSQLREGILRNAAEHITHHLETQVPEKPVNPLDQLIDGFLKQMGI